ncbi:MAG: PEP-CTERM sorting domain-containing protein [Massilia sp.]
MKKRIATLLLSLASAAALAGPATTSVSFSDGTQGWTGLGDGIGGSWISGTPGKHGAAYYTNVASVFGLNWVNNSNTSFLGDYGSVRSVTIEVDVNVKSITYDGSEVGREMFIELRDYSNPYNGMPYTAVWYKLGPLNKKGNWQHYSVTILDTRAAAMPSGWGGLGSGGASLPPGRTFANVLASVQEVAFTTFAPEYAYGYTDFDVAVDNISIRTTPR